MPFRESEFSPNNDDDAAAVAAWRFTHLIEAYTHFRCLSLAIGMFILASFFFLFLIRFSCASQNLETTLKFLAALHAPLPQKEQSRYGKVNQHWHCISKLVSVRMVNKIIIISKVHVLVRRSLYECLPSTSISTAAALAG